MLLLEEKIKMACENLLKYSRITLEKVELSAQECEYKNGNTPPEGEWKPLEYLIGAHRHFWFKGQFTTPAAEEGYDLRLEVSSGQSGRDMLNPQSLLYLNGKMVAGADTRHKEIFLEPATDYTLYNYFYTNYETGPFALNTRVKKVDAEAEGLYYDLSVPFEALAMLEPNTAEYRDTLSALERAVNLIDFRAPGSAAWHESIAAARAFMEREFYQKLCSTDGKPIVHCIGHTHIDVEWQWARQQTREKIQRSAATALMLMERYPEYKFTLTQPELYRYLKEEAPEKYEELKSMVAAGRWEPEGSMWVECDCNITSGESFIRQILQGKKYFKEEFGKDNKVLFLPDVFGYSAALPQILKKSGIDYFVTSKISWNDVNCMPYDSFMWQGIDGTEIFTSFITSQKGNRTHSFENRTNYNGIICPEFVAGTWDRYQQKEYNKNVLMTFGYGDGGGGPTKEMLEHQRRLSRGLPGLPVTKMNFLVPYLEDSYKEFSENTARLKRVPKWVGELYLEFHRGTYTSMAENKRGNRKAELMLQKAEALSYNDLLFGGSYDAKGLYAAWRKVLHDQFHDILPGSSVEEVYEGSRKDYAELQAYGDALIGEKLQALAKRVSSDGGTLVYNSLGFARGGMVQQNGKTLELTEAIPAYGWKVLSLAEPQSRVAVEGLTAENPYYKMILDNLGRIVSLYDKSAEREVLLPGRLGNEFILYEDYPSKYDAWEIENTYKSKSYAWEEPATVTAVFDGSRAGFRVERPYMQSRLVQHIWLYSESRRIDFETEIDWHQKHHLMKVDFPLDVHAEKAAYEIQFGHVYRPTHQNTGWDEAKFEVCAHKWADISENGYGVALLNDCKYGFAADGSTLTLTVLKCAEKPNPHADEGKHLFTYSLLPHIGSLYEAGVIREAYALNQPLETVETVAQCGSLPAEYSLVSCDRENVVIETVKKAEESDDMILRLYESFDSRGKVTVTVPEGFKTAYLCDTLENEQKELTMTGNTVTLPYKNFEILTLKFKR